MKNTLLVAAISMVLVACSSGSSQSTVSPSKKADTPNKTQPSKTDKETSKKETPKKETPKPSRTDKIIDTEQHNIAQSKLNEFILDGKKIDLMPAGLSAGTIFTNDGGNINGDTLTKTVSGTKFKYTRFGILRAEGKDPLSFAQGVETKVSDMPTQDGIEYKGHAVTYKIGKDKFEKPGEFKAIAYFGKRHELIVNPDKGEKKLTAKIKGNSFSFVDHKDKGKGTGKFYGPQAAEFSGTYVEKGHHTTAFGAKRVK